MPGVFHNLFIEQICTHLLKGYSYQLMEADSHRLETKSHRLIYKLSQINDDGVESLVDGIWQILTKVELIRNWLTEVNGGINKVI